MPAIYARDLTPQLMTVDDLAAGWAVNPAPIMKVATPPCVGTFKVTHHSTDKV